MTYRPSYTNLTHQAIIASTHLIHLMPRPREILLHPAAPLQGPRGRHGTRPSQVGQQREQAGRVQGRAQHRMLDGAAADGEEGGLHGQHAQVKGVQHLGLKQLPGSRMWQGMAHHY